MADLDKLVFPLDIDSAILDPHLQQIRQKFAKAFQDLKRQMESLGIAGGATIKGAERFEVGGKEFEARARFTQKEVGPKGNKRLEDVFTVEVQEARAEVGKKIDRDREALKKFKETIRHLPETEQKAAISNWLFSYKDVNNEMGARLNRINERMSNESKRAGRQLDQEARRQQVEARRAVADQRRREAERGRNFANTVLTGSSAAVGLFGAEGFAALNVGFAAMSGGPVGAGISFFSTAIGESARAIQDATEAYKQAAESLNFVSSRTKNAQAVNKALDAFFSIGPSIAETAGLERRLEQARESGRTFAPFASTGEALQQAFGRAIDSTFNSFLKGRPISFQRQFSVEFGKIMAEVVNPQRQLDEALDARRRFVLHMQGNMPGVGNDPVQTWLRIQNAMIQDPLRQEELELMREELKKFDELIDILKMQVPGRTPLQDGIRSSGGATGSW